MSVGLLMNEDMIWTGWGSFAGATGDPTYDPNKPARLDVIEAPVDPIAPGIPSQVKVS